MKKVILLSVSILLICLAYAFAEVPCKINYQGRLIKDNVPVDGTKTMRFSIYDSLEDGDELWTSGDVNVTVHNGLFRYVIGSDGGDLSSIDWTAGQELYLEVEVETEILTPREELSAYPYAINSHLLEGKTKEYFLNTSGDSQTKQGNLNIMGNLGIGTTQPARPLEVNGVVRADAVLLNTVDLNANPIPNPVDGMVACDLDNIIKQYDEGEWKPLSGRVKVWDSGWVFVTGDARGTVQTFTHGLGDIPEFVQIWLSKSNSPTGGTMFQGDGYGAYGSGDNSACEVNKVTPTEIKIRYAKNDGAGYIVNSFDENKATWQIMNGNFYVRVVAMKVN